MLKHEQAREKVNGARLELREVVALVQPELSARAVVEPRRLRDHRRGGVDAVHAFEVRRECAGQPADAAAEIERRAMALRPSEAPRMGEQHRHVVDTGGEEAIDVPAAVAGIGPREHGPQRIDAPQVLPC